MKSFLFALLCFLTAVLSLPATAEDPALSKLAASKRSAVFRLTTKDALSFGVFISKDGHGLVHLQALATKEEATASLPDGVPLKVGSILEVFPEQELALLKFDFSPKFWLELAPTEPKIGETIALVPLKTDNPWDGTISPVVGQVMAKRTTVTANLRTAEFAKVLSLGAGLSAKQRPALGLEGLP